MERCPENIDLLDPGLTLRRSNVTNLSLRESTEDRIVLFGVKSRKIGSVGGTLNRQCTLSF